MRKKRTLTTRISRRAAQGYHSVRNRQQARTLWENLASNPAGIIGPFVAAVVVIVTFIPNYHATLQNQRDTQFYEALKRFGDTSSPAVRASAAQLLAQLACESNVRWFGLQKPTLGNGGYPYFSTTLSQLETGLLTERDPMVLDSIAAATSRLVPINPHGVAKSVQRVNMVAQRQVVTAVVDYYMALPEKDRPSDFLASKQAAEPESVRRYLNRSDAGPPRGVVYLCMVEASRTSLKLVEKHWDRAAALTGYDADVLRTLVWRDRWAQEFTDEVIRWQDRKPVPTADATRPPDELRIAAKRLETSVSLLCALLSGRSWHKADLRDIFLVPNRSVALEYWPRIERAGFTSANLEGAQIEMMTLFNVNLTHASLIRAELQLTQIVDSEARSADFSRTGMEQTQCRGTDLQSASFIDASLCGCEFGSKTNLRNARLDTVVYNANMWPANWWEANFWDSEYMCVTQRSADKIIDLWIRGGYRDVPKDISKVAPSIRGLIGRLRKSAPNGRFIASP